jgi:hypothetical protein
MGVQRPLSTAGIFSASRLTLTIDRNLVCQAHEWEHPMPEFLVKNIHYISFVPSEALG